MNELMDVKNYNGGKLIYVKGQPLTIETVEYIFSRVVTQLDFYLIYKEVCNSYNVECDLENGIIYSNNDKSTIFILSDIFSMISDLFKKRYKDSVIIDRGEKKWVIRMVSDLQEDNEKLVGKIVFFVRTSDGTTIDSLSFADILSRITGGFYKIQPTDISNNFREYVSRLNVVGNLEVDYDDLTVTLIYDVDNINLGTLDYDIEQVFNMYKRFIFDTIMMTRN